MKRAATTHLTCSAPWLLKRQHQLPDAPFTRESFAPTSLLRHSDYLDARCICWGIRSKSEDIRGESHEAEHVRENLHMVCWRRRSNPIMDVDGVQIP